MDKFALRDALLRERFPFFLRCAFGEVVGGTAFASNWHLDAVAHRLEQVRRGETTRLIVTMPPRHLKSFQITTAWVAWMLGRDPAKRFIVASYGQDLSEKHARDCLQIMNAPWYRQAFPRTQVVRRSVGDFETSAGGGRLSTSVGGPLTGRGADIIIIDDPMKADDVLSEARRLEAKTWMYNTLMSRLNRQGTGAIILVMQRLHGADLAGELIDEGGWEELRLSAIAEQDERIATGPGRFHFRRQGEALHPEHLSLEVLEKIRARDPFVFSAQYQQSPVPLRGNFVKPEWFKYYDELPTGGVVTQSWDTASKEGLTNDYSVGITALRYGQQWYLMDVCRERMDFVKLRRRLAALCERYRVERLLIEDASSGTQLLQMLRKSRPNGVPHPIACKATTDKQARFMAQASRIESGEILLPRAAPWVPDFIKELTAFPNGKYDDQADAFAQLCAHAPLEGGMPYGGDIIGPNGIEDPEYDNDFDEEGPDDPLY